MIRIDTYQQYFTVTSINYSKLIHTMYEFNKSLITYRMALLRTSRHQQPKVVSKPDKTFYLAETKDINYPAKKDVLRYPITLLDNVMEFLEDKGFDKDGIEIEHHKPFKGESVDIKPNPKFKPRDYQEEYISKISKTDKHNVLVDLYTGYGKAARNSTLIKKPLGWAPIGELKVGDVVMGRDGKETKVVGVYPQGRLQLYRVTFEDGREIDVCKEHLWTVIKKNKSVTNSFIREVVDTDYIINFIDKEDGYDFFIDLPEPVDHIPVSFSTDPYELGTKVGNGLEANYKGCLEGSKQQRIEFMKGLLDSSGAIEEDGAITFITSDVDIAYDIQLLARSLGGICSKETIITFIRYKGGEEKNREVYKLYMKFKYPNKVIGSDELLEQVNLYCSEDRNLVLKIVSVKEIDIDEATCIAVDNNDKLFIAEDYVVTHNTFISMYSISQIKEKFSLFILPRYIDKWISDVVELTNIKKEEILVIKGLTMLTDILNNPELAKPFKCFIISLTTLNYFVKRYLTGELIEYTTKSPEDLFPALGTSIVLNDETHQEFSNVYRIMLFSNVRLFIGITATLVTKDKDLNRMYEIMFPEENRASNIVAYEPYIYVSSVRFRFNYKKVIRFKNNFGYNQPMFENSIIKNSRVLGNYLKMINNLLKGFYLNKKTKGDKCIIFMGTVNLCSITVDYLKNINRDLVINKYTEEDDYSIIEESDIIISTLASASTALDINNLVTTIQTVNVDSITANLQSLGRLRNLKGKKMDFVYTWTSDIPQHKRYNLNRLKLFSKRAKHLRSIEYRELI